MSPNDAASILLAHNRKVAIAIIKFLLAQPGGIAKSSDIATHLRSLGENKDELINPREYGLYRLNNLIVVAEGSGPGVTYRIAPGAVKFLKEVVQILEGSHE